MNENVERMEQIEAIINTTLETSDIIIAKDLFDQITHILNAILNVAQDVENSSSFCELKVLHSSVIKNNELLLELYYKARLPFEVSYDSIKHYKHIIKPSCVIKGSEIIYTLSIPLFSDVNYKLFYLLSISNGNFQILLPNSKYVLKSEFDIVSLSGICDKIENQYLCSLQSQIYLNASCERNILMDNNFDACPQFQLPQQQILEYVPESNQYIGALPQPTSWRSSCQDITTSQDIQGIFLFDYNPQCQFFVGSQILLFNDSAVGQPLLLENLKLNMPSYKTHYQLPKLQLQAVHLAKLSNQLQNVQLEQESNINPWHLSGTTIIYLILIIATCFLCIKLYKTECRPFRANINVNSNHRPMT